MIKCIYDVLKIKFIYNIIICLNLKLWIEWNTLNTIYYYEIDIGDILNCAIVLYHKPYKFRFTRRIEVLSSCVNHCYYYLLLNQIINLIVVPVNDKKKNNTTRSHAIEILFYSCYFQWKVHNYVTEQSRGIYKIST